MSTHNCAEQESTEAFADVEVWCQIHSGKFLAYLERDDPYDHSGYIPGIRFCPFCGADLRKEAGNASTS